MSAPSCRARRYGRRPVWSAAIVCAVALAPCIAADPLAALQACRALPDATARLACFDRESAALAPSPAPVASPVVAAAPVAAAGAPSLPVPEPVSAPAQPPAPGAAPPAAAPAMTPEQQFGLSPAAIAARERATGTTPAEQAEIRARIERYDQLADGHVVFTLDNGQVWRQLLSGADLLEKPGDVVTISRGWLGSYWLQLQSGRGCKVVRIR